MSKLLSILLSPYNFFFGENGIFPSSIRRGQNNNSQGLYLGLPAIVFAILGVLFLIVGELSAGKTLIQRYQDNVEDVRKEEAELKLKLAQELKIANATQSKIDPNAAGLSGLREKLSKSLNSEEILLGKLYSLAPDQPKHLYELAITFLTKSNLTLLSPDENKEGLSAGQKNQGLSIMKRIAPLDKPGYLDAHLFLAKNALNGKVSSRNEGIANLRLATAHLNNALIRDQENTTAFGLKVLIAQKTGQTEEAKEFLDKLFATDPFVYPQLCLLNNQLGVGDQNIAVLLSAQGRFAESVSRMTGASERRTKYVTYLVDCFHRLEKIDDADKLITKEMKEFPSNGAVQRWGSRLLAIGQELRYRASQPITADNATELIAYLRKGHALDPNNVKILNNIVALRREDNIPGIEEISKEIYQPGPKAPASVENILGTIALRKNDHLKAVRQFSKANAKAPNNAEYLNNLSYVYLTRPDPDPREALKMVDKAIRSVRSGTIRSRYLTNFFDTQGRALLALGKIAAEEGDQDLANSRYTAAAAKLLLALKDRPDNLEISQAVVECYEAVGLTEQEKVWRDRVKQLLAAAAQTEANPIE